jgi:hypothetical protein
MEIPEDSDREQRKLQCAAVAYHAVMLVAFVIGLYGLFSLFSLASAEIRHSVPILGSLP